MSTSLNLKIDKEKVREIPLVDLAFMVLKAANTPYYYRDLMNEVAKQRGMTDEEINEYIAQLYTEINIDGRFACVGTSLWGLKRWYPAGSEDSMTGAKRPRIINDEDDDLEDEDFGEEEDSYNSDEDFDTTEDNQDEDEDEDEDEDDIFDEDDSEEEVLVEDDDLEDEDLDEDDEESEDEEEFADDSDKG
ncbi:DNA-directed RNA polymerase subunit delta [Paenibacillus amylolyticus]|uniref:DNA-directed RNA polymerase subunit delta n=1 Tax=Paenibacillus amylolyticus TaxID=1451 RepID=UPI003EBF14CF